MRCRNIMAIQSSIRALATRVVAANQIASRLEHPDTNLIPGHLQITDPRVAAADGDRTFPVLEAGVHPALRIERTLSISSPREGIEMFQAVGISRPATRVTPSATARCRSDPVAPSVRRGRSSCRRRNACRRRDGDGTASACRPTADAAKTSPSRSGRRRAAGCSIPDRSRPAPSRRSVCRRARSSRTRAGRAGCNNKTPGRARTCGCSRRRPAARSAGRSRVSAHRRSPSPMPSVPATRVRKPVGGEVRICQSSIQALKGAACTPACPTPPRANRSANRCVVALVIAA